MATNSAGLSTNYESDGQLYLGSTHLNEDPFESLSLFPNAARDFVQINGITGPYQLVFFDGLGKECLKLELEGEGK